MARERENPRQTNAVNRTRLTKWNKWRRQCPDTITIRAEADYTFTIPIPIDFEVEVNSVVVKLHPPRPDDIDIQSIEEEIRRREEGPYNPVIILLTVILVITMITFAVWKVFAVLEIGSASA